MDYSRDKRLVMTLDAGGTNFVFTAIQANRQVLEEIVLPAHADNLDRCIHSLVEGFTTVRAALQAAPVAISFAFPGPADYPRGIIGDLPNLPAFRGGVALGPMLDDKFGLPVYINNDGDLFAYGEALAGYLPYVNGLLEQSGSPKRYRNLLGLTIGTGFGGGIVRNGDLFIGDNSIAGEIWLLRDKLHPASNIEHHVSIRGVRREYALAAGVPLDEAPAPKEIHDLCTGADSQKRDAALKAFALMAEAAGDAIANAITLLDGLVVIGGGLAGASDVFLPALVDEMNSQFAGADGSTFRRLAARVYNLEDPAQRQDFLKGSQKEIGVYGTGRKIAYDPEMRIGVGISRLGTSRAVSLGAYAFALNALDRKG